MTWIRVNEIDLMCANETMAMGDWTPLSDGRHKKWLSLRRGFVSWINCVKIVVAEYLRVFSDHLLCCVGFLKDFDRSWSFWLTRLIRLIRFFWVILSGGYYRWCLDSIWILATTLQCIVVRVDRVPGPRWWRSYNLIPWALRVGARPIGIIQLQSKSWRNKPSQHKSPTFPFSMQVPFPHICSFQFTNKQQKNHPSPTTLTIHSIKLNTHCGKSALEITFYDF